MQSCNISMDRCFTSVTIANWALVKSFADVDTMKQYWKVIPKKLKSMNSVKTKFCYGCVLQQKISRCFLTLIRKNLVKKPHYSKNNAWCCKSDQWFLLHKLFHLNEIKTMKYQCFCFCIRHLLEIKIEDNKFKFDKFSFTYGLEKALLLSAPRHYENSHETKSQILWMMLQSLKTEKKLVPKAINA